MKKFLALIFLLAATSSAQGILPRFTERFDSVTIPALPRGWTTTVNRNSQGDFITTTSTPRSVPNAVISTNATISQTLTSGPMDFNGITPVKLEFYTARSSSHTAGLLVEASIDDGVTFPFFLSDTIRNPGVSSYVLSTLSLPPPLAGQAHVRFRWRLTAAPNGGPTGTFRLDDISVTASFSYDLALVNLDAQSPSSPGQGITLRATVRNVGSQPMSAYSVLFFKDLNRNSLPEKDEQFDQLPGPTLSPSDSAVITTQASSLCAGDNFFIALLSSSNDANPSNDTAAVVTTAGATSHSLVINEIMYEPLSGLNEWLEFYNRGSVTVDIVRWKFSDRPTASGVNSFVITSTSELVQPGDFVLVAADTTIVSQYPYLKSSSSSVHLFILNRTGGFGLNNDGDDIVLRDAVGNTIDSASYSPSWHHPEVSDTKGRSLERINPDLGSNDPRNWSTSPGAGGGTPGRANGIYTTSLPASASISFHPNPFSPDGDGFEDFCVFSYNLPLTTSIIRITIFDIRGRLLRTLANCELSGSHGEVIWDGLDDTRQRVRIGPYVVFIEAIDKQGGVLATAKAVVVVATKL